MSRIERQQRIIEQIRHGDRVKVASLADDLEVSVVMIRQDPGALQARRLLTRRARRRASRCHKHGLKYHARNGFFS